MKLLTLLKSLQPDEHKELEKFLDSPFHRTSEQHLVYFKYFRKHHKDFDLDKAALETAYRRCFGKDSYTDHKLYNLMSGLAKQVEQFMAVKILMNSNGSHLQQALLVRALGERNMGTYFQAEAEQLIEEIQAKPVKAAEDYLLLEQLYHQVYFNPDTTKHLPKPSSLQLAADCLDTYYTISKLRYASEMKARERILKDRYQTPLLPAVLSSLTEMETGDRPPLLTAYLGLLEAYTIGVDENNFKRAKEMFVQDFERLPESDKRLLLTQLINCGMTLRSSEIEVNQELYTLYKLAIRSNMLLENNRITHVTFANVVAIAALCKEPDWAASFVVEYAPHLEPNKKEGAVALSWAFIHYHKGELDAAQKQLIAPIFKLKHFDIPARVLLAKIAFDQYLVDSSNYEFLFHNLDSFEKYVACKESLSADRVAAVLGFVRFVRKMMRVSTDEVPVSGKSKELLEAKLNKEEYMISRKWLEERVHKL